MEHRSEVEERMFSRLDALTTTTSGQTESQAAAEAQYKIATSAYTEAKAVANAEATHMATTTIGMVSSSLARIAGLIEDGEDALEDESYNEAFIAFHTAHRQSQQLMVAVRASVRSGIVPLTPSTTRAHLRMNNNGMIEGVRVRAEVRQELREEMEEDRREAIEELQEEVDERQEEAEDRREEREEEREERREGRGILDTDVSATATLSL